MGVRHLTSQAADATTLSSITAYALKARMFVIVHGDGTATIATPQQGRLIVCMAPRFSDCPIVNFPEDALSFGAIILHKHQRQKRLSVFVFLKLSLFCAAKLNQTSCPGS